MIFDCKRWEDGRRRAMRVEGRVETRWLDVDLITDVCRLESGKNFVCAKQIWCTVAQTSLAQTPYFHDDERRPPSWICFTPFWSGPLTTSPLYFSAKGDYSQMIVHAHIVYSSLYQKRLSFTDDIYSSLDNTETVGIWLCKPWYRVGQKPDCF